MFIILVLDPAASTGYCLVRVDKESKKANIYEQGFIDVVVKDSVYQGDHCISLMNKVEELIDTHNVCHVAVEDYFFNGSTSTGANVNVAYRAAIHIEARKKNIPYTILNISSCKKYVAGRATPTKQQKETWGPVASKKLYMQEALYTKYNIRFPNYSISQKNGKPIAFRYDIVDAVAQAIYVCHAFFGINDVTSTVTVPNDNIFTKPPKYMYSYPLV